MKTMIAAVLASALAAGVGGLALGANPPATHVGQPQPAFAHVAPRPAMLLARHDNDNDEGEPQSDVYEPHEGKGHKEGHKGKHGKYAEQNYRGPFFRPMHAGYFRECYGGVDVQSLPPGLQKQVERTGHLPPGLEKHLERNGTLPPGLQKRMSPANPCVLGRLGPLPPNSRLYMLDRDAYLINYHTHRILDIFRGAY